MHISEFDYELPPKLIATEPARPRDAARMMVVKRSTQECIDTEFRKLPDFLDPSDVVVLNDTRVLRARVFGKLKRQMETIRNVEVLFSAPLAERTWEVMCRPGRHVRRGDRLVLGESEIEGEFGESRQHGLRALQLNTSEPIELILDKYGHIPLPPYIDREANPQDIVEYQTVYAMKPGAVAAPTAGLHFSDSTFKALADRGIEVITITLHVGIGTFLPVRTDDPRNHVLKAERFEVTPEAAERLNAAAASKRRIVAVGTTTTRVLEYLMHRDGGFRGTSGDADLFILPGFQFRAVGALLTNFHLPRSTLLMLVSAFASDSLMKRAYQQAIGKRYRFYSYGDCMLIVT